MFVPITKVDAVQRLVYGSLASEQPDRSNEVFDYATSKPLIEAWSGDIKKATDGKSEGNLRAMHTKKVAGKFTSVICNDVTKSVDVCAKVVDDDEWKMVEEGCYTGFSVGGEYIKKWKDPNDPTLMRYTAKPNEGSLADLPCNPGSSFIMVKADGVEELRKFHVATPAPDATPSPATPLAPALSGPLAPAVKAVGFDIAAKNGVDGDITQGFRTADGSFFLTKAEARTHTDALAKTVAVPATPAAKLAAELAGLKADVTKAQAPETTPAPVVKGRALKRVAKTVAVPGADKTETLRKGLYGVARLASLITELDWLQQDTEYEAASEGDGSPMPTTLKDIVGTLCTALLAMATEETKELMGGDDVEILPIFEMAFRTAGVDALGKLLGANAPAALAKVGARHGDEDAKNLAAAHDSLSKMGFGKCAGMGKATRFNASDAKNLQKAHDHMTKAGAPCAGKDAGTADDAKDDAKDDDSTEKVATATLTKALDDEKAKTTGLEKQMSETAESIAELRKTFTETVTDLRTKLSKLAMPRPHERVHTVTKGDPASDGDLASQLAALPQEERTAALIKFARMSPIQISR